MSAALQPGHVLFDPNTRKVLHVTGARGTWLFLSEVFGDVRASVDTARRPDWGKGLEDLGHPGADLGPVGWTALRVGVLAAEDHAGRVEAVRTARELAANYGPASQESMSAAISPDVLETLDRIRERQAARGCSFEEALATAQHDLGKPAIPEGMRVSLVAGIAWALYALELHDAAAEEAHRGAGGRT